MKKSILALGVFLFILSSGIQSTAQSFIPAFNSFSHKKTAYVYLEDGSEVTCTIKKLSRSKGQIDDIKLEDLDGKKIKISPEEVSHMYLPPSSMGKLANFNDFMGDATQWGNTDVDNDIISKGYAYFEKVEAKIKKKTMTLNMQLINPSFSNKIKVYIDPLAKESASIGIGGIDVAGGNDKSYFIKKVNENSAYKIEKKNYDEEFKMIFSDCPSLIEKYGDNPKWSDLATHIYEYTNACK